MDVILEHFDLVHSHACNRYDVLLVSLGFGILRVTGGKFLRGFEVLRLRVEDLRFRAVLGSSFAFGNAPAPTSKLDRQDFEWQNS